MCTASFGLLVVDSAGYWVGKISVCLVSAREEVNVAVAPARRRRRRSLSIDLNSMALGDNAPGRLDGRIV